MKVRLTRIILMLLTGLLVIQAGRTEIYGKVPENELPYGLTGMSADHVLTGQDAEYKRKLTDNNVIKDLSKLTPDKDYKDREVIFSAEDEEEAYAVARAYNAEVKSISPHLIVTLILPESGEEAFRNYYENTEKLATISSKWSDELEIALKEADTDHEGYEALSVYQAVKAGADPGNTLPPVEPNYIIRLDPREMQGGFSETGNEEAKSFDSTLPTQTGLSWWAQNLKDPDPFLIDPQLKYESAPQKKVPSIVTAKYQYFHDMLGTYKAWGTTTGNSDVCVAVIDTGVMASHEELNGRVVRKFDAHEGMDLNMHGTAVAGLIGAAMNNAKGGAGIAPGVTIYDYRVLDSDGSGNTSDIIEAVYQAVDDGAWVINMSLGSYVFSNEEEEACRYAHEKNTAVITAMGNDASNIKIYPAFYDSVFAVASVNESGMKSYHSNYGPWCDIAAPGMNIFTASNQEGPYGYYSFGAGTSFAAPIVSGTAALYMSRFGRVPVDECFDVLRKTAVKSPSADTGAGIVNAAALFEADTEEPVIEVSEDKTSAVISSGLYSFDRDVLLYTLDGSDPAILNGEILNGKEIKEGEAIDISGFKDGVLIKAARVNGYGVLSRTAEVKVGNPSEAICPLSIKVTGPKGIQPGKEGQYKACVYPDDSQYDSLTLSLKDAPAEVVLKDGIVSVPKEVTGGSFTVMASLTYTDASKTERTLESSINVTVASEPASLRITGVNDPKVSVTCEGDEVKSILLYTENTKGLPDSVKVIAETGNGIGPVWKTEDSSKAIVDEDGNLTALSGGSTTVTCTADDGSGLTKSFTLNIYVPASGLDIVTPNDEIQIVAAGSGIDLTAAIGSAYGKPTVSKVSWEIESLRSGKNGSALNSQLKYLELDSRGHLSVSEKFFKKFKAKTAILTVKARTTDGTDITDTQDIYIVRETKKFYVAQKNKKRKVRKINMGLMNIADFRIISDLGDSIYNLVEIISSDPEIASASTICSDKAISYISGNKPGNARVTIRLMDGSEKEYTVYVKVSEY